MKILYFWGNFWVFSENCRKNIKILKNLWTIVSKNFAKKIFRTQVEDYVMEQIWCTISTIQQKLEGGIFFLARDCIWKLTFCCKRIFLVPKIPRFLTFFEKIFRLRSIIFETKKKAFRIFHDLSIEHTFGARGAGQKKFTRWKVFFCKLFERYMGSQNLETKRESFGDKQKHGKVIPQVMMAAIMKIQTFYRKRLK